MKVREEQIGDVAVLTPVGDMDLNELPVVEARVARLLAAGTHNLIWNLRGVDFLPSTAAGFLFHTARRMRAAGGRCVLVGGQPRVLGVLRTMGVLEVLPTYPDRASALEYFAD